MKSDRITSVPDVERMMSEYGDTILRLCYMYLKDHQLAEDATQEAFIRAYCKYPMFKGDSSEKTWITRIAINICKDMMRRRSWGEKPPEDTLPDSVSSLASPEAQAETADRDRLIIEAVMSLDDIYKEVILLFYYNGLKISEIAKTLNMREGTVKTRLMRARGILGSVLKEEYL